MVFFSLLGGKLARSWTSNFIISGKKISFSYYVWMLFIVLLHVVIFSIKVNLYNTFLLSSYNETADISETKTVEIGIRYTMMGRIENSFNGWDNLLSLIWECVVN